MFTMVLETRLDQSLTVIDYVCGATRVRSWTEPRLDWYHNSQPPHPGHQSQSGSPAKLALSRRGSVRKTACCRAWGHNKEDVRAQHRGHWQHSEYAVGC